MENVQLTFMKNWATNSRLEKKQNGEDPIIWAKKYIENLNKKIAEDNVEIILRKSTSTLIPLNQKVLFNGGYLFLEDIYYKLKLDIICKEISKKYKFEFDLNNILSRLIYGRIIFPSSKLATHELSKSFIEAPSFELHDIYRALEIIAKETDYIQSELYKNSKNIIERNTKILYYDCTNYFFELEQEDGLKQYGPSKEHRPNPIVQMGLFMDGNGIPLAFNITPGNTNEQITLKPLEEKIIKDFELSKFVVCTDAGLASIANRKFNNIDDRAFITTQSIKQLKKHLKDWSLDKNDWHILGSKKTFNIEEIENNEELKIKYKDTIFYKERWIKENDLEQKLIVTFSLKYKNYQKQIRDSQIERARKAIEKDSGKIDKHNQNDFKRFIKRTNVTKDGEVAENKSYSIDENQIAKEEKYDGYYGVCTNLEGSVEDIININKNRWEIEESFRIMKSEFKARPVYLSRDDRISAHFTTCFLSLIILRILEKKINEKYTVSEILETLRNMNFCKEGSNGFIPLYERTDITDLLHDTFGFRTDYEIVSQKRMKKILKNLKK